MLGILGRSGWQTRSSAAGEWQKGCSSANRRSMMIPAQCSLRFFSKPPSNSTSSTSSSNGIVPVSYGKLVRGLPIFSTTIKRGGASVAERDVPAGRIKFQGVHHVGLLCQNLEESLKFYKDTLGLEENPDRPHHKLPYRGAWLWIGPEMIHLMELPDPDPKDNRPEHGGRDRHFCIGVADVKPLIARLEAGGVKFTTSMSGRPAVFFRDPDMNCLEVAEMGEWR
ncbi:Glyoxalase/Bleomycin resistance protein/Dihydroxybiphenyl dioxygenase [Dunaliella salina]|uniref:Glyoxalase/Bleomycin resistance protein/Dihydroxybiphenyl dioxygenase n=1 Tax=Dunaliella salina TaxID=3046 RepID=A0ABQ7H8L3_DUNSA|nr:Glyoxalase/Bleomycin resistance protein/Dihydroxybiphenyl dioxygenase [Dunaliella salina]|eukprot:KAF5843189.1 Glyoxalase/Bleomycin resistance protein/Dihydroxybiphenyl dioxygenase [Dunaliella salina]